MSDQPAAPPPDPIPTASTVPPGPRMGWYWIFPFLALVVVAVVLSLTWARRGVAVTLRFREGHGLKPGDAVRSLGIVIGEVRSVRLDPDAGGVLVQADLQPEAREIAREGTRFWIARPQADLTSGLQGLDTVVGAKYVIAQPGGGTIQFDFVGLEAPPIPETIEHGGRHLILQANRLGGLRPGAPVTFRQVRIGSVLSVGLASDASAVDVQVYVRPAYARLVRDNSKFWNTSGVHLATSMGLPPRLELGIESAEALLMGGVSMATPPKAGKPVESGKRFDLESEANPEWLKWKPELSLADTRVPEKAKMPRPVAATLLYKVSGRLWGTRSETRRGVVVPVGKRLLGPTDLVRVPKNSAGEGELSLLSRPPATVVVPVGELTTSVGWLETATPVSAEAAPQLRVPKRGPEDCVLVADAERQGRAVSVARLKEIAGVWEIDTEWLKDVNVPDWHGAAAVAAADGCVVGVVLAKDRTKAVIVPLDDATVK